ncbi:hypothetical protein OJAV_G00187720 [Oryzias javanicus]|uniref:Uncharacterized protein n=1 Tax=Oryzias javanicus TaxID=123683 RepID=A0A437C9A8_ORYJA|nr:hypothetical protein OJAV_G00187720 [Oryzias javanicus]
MELFFLRLQITAATVQRGSRTSSRQLGAFVFQGFHSPGELCIFAREVFCGSADEGVTVLFKVELAEMSDWWKLAVMMGSVEDYRRRDFLKRSFNENISATKMTLAAAAAANDSSRLHFPHSRSHPDRLGAEGGCHGNPLSNTSACSVQHSPCR